MAYQSFPWVKGDSRSYHKLLALQLPNLKNKSFLDVGCNEGYFCGYAHFMEASNVTGIDINPKFLSVAKTLFPDCNFICQSWDNLGEDRYDVILSASAIHYAPDQKGLVDLLMSRLAPNGTLVLEIGVAPGTENEFIEIKRSIDARLFPTKSKLIEMLDGYAYKFISRSAPQAGDPIPREVYHITKKLPYAVLLLDDPHAGKTFTVKELFKKRSSQTL